MTELLAALIAGIIIVLGIVGTVVPLLPGSLLVAVGVVGYAVVIGENAAWIGAGIALLVLAIGVVAKWLVPARAVSGEVDNLPLVIGAIAAVVGFFVIPFLGIPIGFILGVLGTELVRKRRWSQAWPATQQAIKAAGLSMLIELAAVVVAGCIWLATILVLVVF